MDDLKDYIMNLKYDPNRILAVVGSDREDTVTRVVKYSDDPKSHKVIRVTKKIHDCAKNLDQYYIHPDEMKDVVKKFRKMSRGSTTGQSIGYPPFRNTRCKYLHFLNLLSP